MPGALEAHLAGVAENNPALKPVLNDYTLANDLDRQPHATHVGSRGLSSRSVSSWATKARRDSVVNIAGRLLGQQRDKLFREALRMQLAQAGEDLKALREIADILITEAKAGNIQAIKELADRLDGKPTQMLEHTAPSSLPPRKLIYEIVHVTETPEQLKPIENVDYLITRLRRLMATGPTMPTARSRLTATGIGSETNIFNTPALFGLRRPKW